MSEYYPPEYESDKFECMHCKVYAHQTWSPMYIQGKDTHEVYIEPADSIKYFNSFKEVNINKEPVNVSLCSYCDAPTLWVSEKIIFPLTGVVPPVNSDLSDDVKAIYDEAAAIANQSPRAASALLRLAIETLLKELGEKGNINDAIKNMVKKGLDQRVQQSLDIVRVIGNNAVHPGQIVFDDNTDVQILFQLINIIANFLITQPKQIQGAYDNLPEDARNAIEERDSNTQ